MIKQIGALAFTILSTGAIAAPSPTQIGTTKTSNPYPVSILYNGNWYPMGSINTTAGNFISAVANGGTGLSSGTANGIPYFATSSTMSSTSAGAANTLLTGNGSSSAPTFNSLTSVLDSAFSSTQGSILYRGSSGWAALSPGTSGYVLTSNGSGANPSWAAGGGGGSSTPLNPGGRLTLTASTPYMICSAGSSGCVGYSAQSTVYYAPYIGQYVPIYNGSSFDSVQFTSSSTDTVGLSLTLSSSWSANTTYDVYVTKNGGSTVLCTSPWANSSNRNGSYAYPADAGTRIQGILTNTSTTTCSISGGSTISMAANRGTYLGSFTTDPSSYTVTWKWGGSASGGDPAILNIWNYYNRIKMGALVFDIGYPYVLTTLPPFIPSTTTVIPGAAARIARNSTGNSITFTVGRGEDSYIAAWQTNVNTLYATGTTSPPNVTSGLCLNTFSESGVSNVLMYAAGSTQTSIPINGQPGYVNTSGSYVSPTATTWGGTQNQEIIVNFISRPGFIGLNVFYGCEAGDGTNNNLAGTYAGQQLSLLFPM